MRQLALLAIATMLSTTAYADKEKDKGYADRADDHGQVVAECNHRANQRNLKGQDRKNFVEWCESRGARYGYDDRRYDRDRDCYRKADDKGLTGDRRKSYLDRCFEGRDGDRKADTDGVGKYGEPRGRDVLGKGSNK